MLFSRRASMFFWTFYDVHRNIIYFNLDLFIYLLVYAQEININFMRYKILYKNKY